MSPQVLLCGFFSGGLLSSYTIRFILFIYTDWWMCPLNTEDRQGEHPLCTDCEPMWFPPLSCLYHSFFLWPLAADDASLIQIIVNAYTCAPKPPWVLHSCNPSSRSGQLFQTDHNVFDDLSCSYWPIITYSGQYTHQLLYDVDRSMGSMSQPCYIPRAVNMG